MDAVYTLLKTGDKRLQQVKESYTAMLGAASINFVQYTSQAPTTSTVTWTVVPPSTTTVFQKSPMLDITCLFVFFVQQTTYMDPNGVPLAKYGRDWAFAAASPVNALVNSWSIQLNNTNIQAQKVTLNDTIHCIRTPDQRASDTVTYRTPAYASWNDADGTTQGLGSFADMQGEGDIPPGAYEVTFTDGQGKPLNSQAQMTYQPRAADASLTNWGWDPSQTGQMTIKVVSGQPVTDISYASGPATDVVQPLSTWNGTDKTVAAIGFSIVPLFIPMYVQVRLIDVVMCSPFGFDYMHTFDTVGFFGVASMQFNAQLTTAVNARSIQGCSNHGCILLGPNAVVIAGAIVTPSGQAPTIGPVYKKMQQSNPTDQQLVAITQASIWFTYISPMQYAVLPEQNIMPMAQLVYYPQIVTSKTNTGPVIAGGPLTLSTVNFNSVTFPAVPDLIFISVRPNVVGQAPDEADWSCTFPDQPFTQFNFANNPAILSGVQAFQLSQISRKNGLRDSLAVLGGSTGSGYLMSNGRKCVAGGGLIVLRPGLDFPLPEGASPGTNGQVQMNFNLQFLSPGSYPGRDYVCLVTAVMKGFFITAAGTSRLILVGLENSQVLAAPPGPDMHSTAHLLGGSMAGGGVDWGGLFNKGMNMVKTYGPVAKEAFSTGKNLYDKFKDASSQGSGLAGGAIHRLAGAKRSMTDRLCM